MRVPSTQRIITVWLKNTQILDVKNVNNKSRRFFFPLCFGIQLSNETKTVAPFDVYFWPLLNLYLCCFCFNHQSIMLNKGSLDKHQLFRYAVTLPFPSSHRTCSSALGWSSIPSVQGDPIPQRHHLPENTTLASTSASRAKALRGKEGMLWAPLAREGSSPCFTRTPLVTTMVAVGSPSPRRRWGLTYCDISHPGFCECSWWWPGAEPYLFTWKKVAPGQQLWLFRIFCSMNMIWGHAGLFLELLFLWFTQ